MFKRVIGHCGPTDACYKLISPDGETREYLIESIAWLILERGGEYVSPELAMWIFENRQDDEKIEGKKIDV